MKRILVIGCPGSGKSYFSKKLAKKTGLPLCHLDMLSGIRTELPFHAKSFLNVSKRCLIPRNG